MAEVGEVAEVIKVAVVCEVTEVVGVAKKVTPPIQLRVTGEGVAVRLHFNSFTKNSGFFFHFIFTLLFMRRLP